MEKGVDIGLHPLKGGGVFRNALRPDLAAEGSLEKGGLKKEGDHYASDAQGKNGTAHGPTLVQDLSPPPCRLP